MTTSTYTKKIKEMTHSGRQRIASKLIDENNQIITEAERQADVWKEYINRPFNESRTSPVAEAQLQGPHILKDDLRKAINQSKNRAY